MFRYLAFVWNDADPAARGDCGDRSPACSPSVRRPRRAVVETDGLRVYSAGERLGSSEACVLHGGAGAVLREVVPKWRAGKALRRPPPSRSPKMSPDRSLTAQATGSSTRTGGGMSPSFTMRRLESPAFLRDPSAGMPCYSVSYGRRTHLFLPDGQLCPSCRAAGSPLTGRRTSPRPCVRRSFTRIPPQSTR